MTLLTDKTKEELIEQITRMQDRIARDMASNKAGHEAIMKRCADYRKAARLANKRADDAERKLKILRTALERMEP